MLKEKKVVDYYVVCNRLKDVVRTGWMNWHVTRNRIESVAEHIFGVQMLALAMKSEYKYDVDIMRVIYMLAIHELGEAVIGDLTSFQISKDEKKKIEHEAVHKILDNLLDGNFIEELFLEFDEGETEEAMFAYQCDKLECDLQCKLYDEEGCVDINKQDDNDTIKNERYQNLYKTETSWSSMWIKFDQQVISFDKNFKAISDYIMSNKIGEEKDNQN